MNYSILAFHAGKRMDLRKLEQSTPLTIIKRDNSFLLLQKAEEQFVYVKNYGSVVFCNVEKDELRQIFTEITGRKVNFEANETEQYEVEINAEKPQGVNFNTVFVNAFSLDRLHIVMLNLAQSVALDYYQAKTNALLEQTSKISATLETTGDIGIPRSKLRKFIGRTMTLKSRIAENLLIFETSDLAWYNEELSELDTELRKQLDVVNRHHGLQYSLDIVKENLDLFRDILHHKHSSTLEWIIIILILLEVADLITSKLF